MTYCIVRVSVTKNQTQPMIDIPFCNLNLELDQQLRQLREQTGILSARKSELNAIPHRDPEFLRYMSGSCLKTEP